MRIRFNEAKVTQAAAYLLKLRGGRMKYIKLIKLLYLADRKSFLDRGRTISTDTYVSMEHGPVLSITLNLIGGSHRLTDRTWEKTISTVEDWDVKLKKPDAEIGVDELSFADIETLDTIYAQFGHWNRWRLIDEVMHKLPEWRDPGNSMIPIRYREILQAGGLSEDEQKAIEGQIDNLTETQDLLTDSFA
jgi:uncharacterized phage-associated protein